MVKQKDIYSEEDIAVVIPTYNRSEDIDKTIYTLLKNNKEPGAIYIVDQSSNKKTEKVVKRYKKFYKMIHFIHSSPPSTAKASNIGLKKASKFKITLMLDDDVDCLPGFLKGLLFELNNYPKLCGVAAWTLGEERKNPDTIIKRMQEILLNFFLLPAPTNKKFKVLGPYGNTGSYTKKKKITDAEWFPGVNMCYKTEALKDYHLPEPIGYNLLQDIDLSYHVFKKCGRGSLVITDKALVKHRYSQVERYDDLKRTFVSQEDRFIFYYRHFHNLLGTFKLLWSIFGLALLKSGTAIVCPTKENKLKIKYFLKSLFYCIKNKEEIEAGKYRKFLNFDLYRGNLHVIL